MAHALPVDRLGREFLAAAGFAGYVDRRLAAREPVDHLARQSHLRAVAKQRMPGRRAAGTRMAGGRHALVFRQFQRRLDQRPQLVHLHRLGQIVERAGLERGHGVLGAAEGGDHRHRHLRPETRGVLEQREPVTVGQPHVGQADIVMMLLQQPARLEFAIGNIGGQAHPVQREAQEFADIRFVVDDERACAHRCRFVAAGHASGLAGCTGCRGWVFMHDSPLPRPGIAG